MQILSEGSGRLPGMVNGKSSESVAVVLAGAGARGAFEAGAMAGLLPALQEQGRLPRIFCGSSAGAINSVLLAGLAHLPPEVAAERLSEEWDRLLGQMIRSVGFGIVASGARYAAGRARLPIGPDSLLDPPGIRDVLGRWDGWDDLHRNVQDGTIDAVALTATDLTTDRTIVHVEAGPGVELPEDDLDRGVFYVPTRLGLEHVYASSAIPVLFPPVALTKEGAQPSWAVDGGVRLNVPLKPALDLGADRLVVVSTDVTARPLAANDGGVPTAIDVLDQLLHLATGDRLLEDLRTLTQINQLVEAGADANSSAGRPYRKVPALVIAPHHATDIGNLVGQALGATPARVFGPLVNLLSRVTGLPGASVPDLATFLLFLPAFTRRAVELGRRRAKQILDESSDGWHENPAAALPPGTSTPAPAVASDERRLRSVRSS